MELNANFSSQLSVLLSCCKLTAPYLSSLLCFQILWINYVTFSCSRERCPGDFLLRVILYGVPHPRAKQSRVKKHMQVWFISFFFFILSCHFGAYSNQPPDLVFGRSTPTARPRSFNFFLSRFEELKKAGFLPRAGVWFMEHGRISPAAHMLDCQQLCWPGFGGWGVVCKRETCKTW